MNLSLLQSQSHEEFPLLPKDQYGIPILPEFAELNTNTDHRSSGTSSPASDDLGEANEFDTATYGLWSTIMNSPDPRNGEFNVSTSSPPILQQSLRNHEFMRPERKNRLEEFTSAFLGLSVFDLADVWVPVTGVNGSVTLHNVFAVSSSTSVSSGVSYFKNLSKNTVIKGWSGAVGRAQCTGNPVWSINQVRLLCRKVLHPFLVWSTAMNISILSFVLSRFDRT